MALEVGRKSFLRNPRSADPAAPVGAKAAKPSMALKARVAVSALAGLFVGLDE